MALNPGESLVQVVWRTPRLRRVIFAAEVFRSTHGRITVFVQFGQRTIWLRRPW